MIQVNKNLYFQTGEYVWMSVKVEVKSNIATMLRILECEYMNHNHELLSLFETDTTLIHSDSDGLIIVGN